MQPTVRRPDKAGLDNMLLVTVFTYLQILYKDNMAYCAEDPFSAFVGLYQ